jgi:hypothetical protein
MGTAKNNPPEQKQSNPGEGASKTDSAKKDTAKRNSENKTQPGEVPRTPGAGHFDDKYRREAGNEDFARRGGVLQLEELKKKVTPDLLKQLNWTEKDWQQFQEQARRYETARQKPQTLPGKDKIRSGSSLLPSTGPRQVGASPDARSDDLSGAQALPPPEFREAQRIFTSRPEGTPAAPGR